MTFLAVRMAVNLCGYARWVGRWIVGRKMGRYVGG